MKTMTCKELGGVCDETFSANSFEEMVELSKAHGQEMFQKGDQAHIEMMKEMMELMKDPVNFDRWFDLKRQQFARHSDD